MRKCLLQFLLFLMLIPSIFGDVTPDQYLASRPKPNFALNHRNPRLSKFSWPYSYNLRKEMTENWGYGLEFSADTVGTSMWTNVNDIDYQCLQLSISNPVKYPLSTTVPRFWSYGTWDTNLVVSTGMWVTNSDGNFVDNATNIWSGSIKTNGYFTIVSPESSDSDWQAVAAWTIIPLQRIMSSNASIAIVLNGGEYGMGVSGFDEKSWQFDPRFIANRATNSEYLYYYISKQKSRQEMWVSKAIRETVPNREMYVFYNTGNEQGRFHQPGYNWERDWARWGWDSQYINPLSDLPSFESYYNRNSYLNSTTQTWNQVTDMLSRYLQSISYNKMLGSNDLNYTWVTGGYTTINENLINLSNIPRYMGFLKCIYTAGTIGANAGYYSYPPGGQTALIGGPGFNASFPITTPPHWLMQIETLSHVHAMFTHLEDFIYNSDIIHGPQMSKQSTDLYSYELTNNAADYGLRVVARKHRVNNMWLVTTWASGGPDRLVTFTIPDLGLITLLARDCGSTYYVNSTTNSVMVDLNGLYPSFNMSLMTTNTFNSLIGRIGTINLTH